MQWAERSCKRHRVSERLLVLVANESNFLGTNNIPLVLMIKKNVFDANLIRSVYRTKSITNF